MVAIESNKITIPPVIIAIRDPIEWVTIANLHPPGWIFILGGGIDEVMKAVSNLNKLNWTVFMHADMTKGITNDYEGIKFIKKFVQPVGVISTHSQTMSHANKLGLLGIQRIFLLDSLSIESGIKQVTRSSADAVEVLPGVLPDIIARLSKVIAQPLIAGGLVQTKEHVREALKAGAVGVSTSSSQLYKMFLDPTPVATSVQSSKSSSRVPR